MESPAFENRLGLTTPALRTSEFGSLIEMTLNIDPSRKVRGWHQLFQPQDRFSSFGPWTPCQPHFAREQLDARISISHEFPQFGQHFVGRANPGEKTESAPALAQFRLALAIGKRRLASRRHQGVTR